MKTTHLQLLIVIVFTASSLSACFGPHEMNPVCWVPEPYGESSRLSSGNSLVNPLQQALNSYYKQKGFFPRDLTTLDFAKGENFTITRYHSNSTRIYRFCDRHQSDSTCSTIRYQDNSRIKPLTHYNPACLKKQELRPVEYKIWWEKNEKCAASRGFDFTAEDLSDGKAKAICPERFSDSVLQAERPSGHESSYPKEECDDHYEAYFLQASLDVFCPPHLITVFHQPGRSDEWGLRYITGK